MCPTAKDDPLPTAQLLGVVRDHLDSQDLFAFAIHLDRQLSEIDFEDRQTIDRSFDHDLVARRSSPLLPLKEWKMLGVKDDRSPQIIAPNEGILERFLKVLRGVDVLFIDNMSLDTWPLASKVGQTQVGSVDVNRPRMRAVMEGVIGPSANPRGFTASELEGKVKEIFGDSVPDYHARQASYDLKKP
jgi:hypothetical protein